MRFVGALGSQAWKIHESQFGSEASALAKHMRRLHLGVDRIAQIIGRVARRVWR
jgi:hypothetical protein